MPNKEIDQAIVQEKIEAAIAESDSEAVGDDVITDDVVADEIEGDITRQGLGSVGSEKEKKPKPRWLVLVKSTLYWYKAQGLTNLKGDIQLKDTEIAANGLAVKILSGKKVVLVLTFMDTSEANDWAATLNKATSLPPGQPPKAVHSNKSRTMASRVNKAVAGKVAVSGVGKAVAKTTLTEEGSLLISSVKNLITLTYDSKTANMVENNIIKLFVKYHYLMQDGVLEEDSWTAMDKGLREAFKWGVKITDNTQSGRVIPNDVLAEWVGFIKTALKQVEKDLFGLLQPHVQAKTLSRIGMSFNIVSSDEFLLAVFKPQENERINVSDSEALTYAMERYLQFSW